MVRWSEECTPTHSYGEIHERSPVRGWGTPREEHCLYGETRRKQEQRRAVVGQKTANFSTLVVRDIVQVKEEELGRLGAAIKRRPKGKPHLAHTRTYIYIHIYVITRSIAKNCKQNERTSERFSAEGASEVDTVVRIEKHGSGGVIADRQRCSTTRVHNEDTGSTCGKRESNSRT